MMQLLLILAEELGFQGLLQLLLMMMICNNIVIFLRCSTTTQILAMR
jgi:hypothetical protein